MKLRPAALAVILSIGMLPQAFADATASGYRISNFAIGGGTSTVESTVTKLPNPALGKADINCAPLEASLTAKKTAALGRQQKAINDTMGFIDFNKAVSCEKLVRSSANKIATGSGIGGFISGAMSQLLSQSACSFEPVNKVFDAYGTVDGLAGDAQDIYDGYQAGNASQVSAGTQGISGAAGNFLTGAP